MTCALTLVFYANLSSVIGLRANLLFCSGSKTYHPEAYSSQACRTAWEVLEARPCRKARLLRDLTSSPTYHQRGRISNSFICCFSTVSIGLLIVPIKLFLNS